MDAGIDCSSISRMPEEFEPYEHELPAGVHYERRPIRDHSLPARPEHMVEILAMSIERALRRDGGFTCTATRASGAPAWSAGCFSSSGERPGEEALDELNRLWQQCERSQSWPYVPETDEQIDFVRNWKPSATPDPVAQLRRRRRPCAAISRRTVERPLARCRAELQSA